MGKEQQENSRFGSKPGEIERDEQTVVSYAACVKVREALMVRTKELAQVVKFWGFSLVLWPGVSQERFSI